MTTYSLQATVNLPYEKAIEKATAALKAEGFGVLTEIDVKQTMKQKIDADFRRYVILGACNPNLAYQALQSELEVGLLLPCNVIVYETGEDESVVSIINPLTMVDISASTGLETVAKEANVRLSRVVKALSR